MLPSCQSIRPFSRPLDIINGEGWLSAIHGNGKNGSTSRCVAGRPNPSRSGSTAVNSTGNAEWWSLRTKNEMLLNILQRVMDCGTFGSSAAFFLRQLTVILSSFSSYSLTVIIENAGMLQERFLLSHFESCLHLMWAILFLY